MKNINRLLLDEPVGLYELHSCDHSIYVFDRHRLSFLCWLKAFNEGRLERDNLLVTIDAHHDIVRLEQKDRKVALSGDVMLATKASVRNTQDWIFMGMEAGIIGDAIIISPALNHVERKLSEPLPFVDSSGKKHDIVFFSCIEDFEKNCDRAIPKKVIFDLDMDYFLIAGWMRPKKHFPPWPEIQRAREFKKSIKLHIRKKDRISAFCSYFTEGKLKKVVSSARVFTIAYEHHYSIWCSRNENPFRVGMSLAHEIPRLRMGWVLPPVEDDEDER